MNRELCASCGARTKTKEREAKPETETEKEVKPLVTHVSVPIAINAEEIVHEMRDSRKSMEY